MVITLGAGVAWTGVAGGAGASDVPTAGLASPAGPECADGFLVQLTPPLSSMRGHNAPAFNTCRSPDDRHLASSSSRHSLNGRTTPTLRRISVADEGMTGDSRIAAMRTASVTSQ